MNKGNKNFQATDEIEGENHGTKRTLISYWKSVKTDANLDPTVIWSRIEKLAQRLLKTMIPHLRMCLEQQKSKSGAAPKNNLHLMHILGLDVILDAEGHPWLLEVNSMPSMAIESTEASQEEKQAGTKPVGPRANNPRIDSKRAGKVQLTDPSQKVNKLVRSKTTNPLKPAAKPTENPPKEPEAKCAEPQHKPSLVDVYVKTQ